MFTLDPLLGVFVYILMPTEHSTAVIGLTHFASIACMKINQEDWSIPDGLTAVIDAVKKSYSDELAYVS